MATLRTVSNGERSSKGRPQLISPDELMELSGKLQRGEIRRAGYADARGLARHMVLNLIRETGELTDAGRCRLGVRKYPPITASQLLELRGKLQRKETTLTGYAKTNGLHRDALRRNIQTDGTLTPKGYRMVEAEGRAAASAPGMDARRNMSPSDNADTTKTALAPRSGPDGSHRRLSVQQYMDWKAEQRKRRNEEGNSGATAASPIPLPPHLVPYMDGFVDIKSEEFADYFPGTLFNLRNIDNRA